MPSTVIALTTSEIILKEDLQDATSWRETFWALYKFATIRFRANGYIVSSWALSLWTLLDQYIRRSNVFILFSGVMLNQ